MLNQDKKDEDVTKEEFMEIRKGYPYKVFKICYGLSNWCPRGEIDLDSRSFICQLKDHHHGIILKNTQLNRPPCGSTG